MGYALKEIDHREKPDGGYVHISTFRFCMAWWCYLEGKLTIRAVRVLLALHELGIRRAAFGWTEKKHGRGLPEFTPRFAVRELAEFCGLPEKRAKSALKELLTLGLVVEFSAERITFARSIDELTLSDEERSEFWKWSSHLTARKRVPIPRRILTLACESSSPAQIAFIIGASLRCVYLHPKAGGFTYTGWLSLSWLSDRMGVCARSLKAAKSHLVKLGWVTPQGRVGRFGELLAINPAWNRIASTHEATTSESVEPLGTNSAPLPAAFGTNDSPPRERESSFGTEIQRPRESHRPEAENSGLGIFQNSGELKPEDQTAKVSPPVRLSSIKTEDFQDVSRSLELFRQAVKCKLVPDDGEHTRLRWMAAIERARTVPANNPAGVFLHIIKNQKWDYLSDGHWFAAHERLKAHEFGTRAISPETRLPFGEIGSMFSERTAPRPPQAILSKDAALIKTLRCLLAQRGVRNQDLLPLLRREDPSWNRERLVSAELELTRPNYLEAAR